MKRSLHFVLVFLFVMIFSCRKDQAPAEQFPENEVKATISIDGTPPITCASKGNETLFAKRTESNGQVLTTIAGCNMVRLYLVGISSPGTYQFDSTSTGTYAWCEYVVGNPFAPTDMFTSHYYTRQTGNIAGSVTIDVVSSSYIKGSFSASCMSYAGKLVTMAGGSFKGTI